jgi:hypothetical protein
MAQVIILKQEKVAALLDNDAHIASVSAYELDTKPHGHGDVHTLLCSSGLAKQWAEEGRKYLLFFQVCACPVVSAWWWVVSLGVCVSLLAGHQRALFHDSCCLHWLQRT